MGALIASLLQRWVVRSDTERELLSAVPALLSSLQCQQGHGTSKAKGAPGLLHTSTLGACHSQRTQSLKSAHCVLPVAPEKENKASLDFFLLEIPVLNLRIHTM